MESLSVSAHDVIKAAEVISGVANLTPVMTSRTLNERTGAEVFVKCENFQRTGSFKFRGAFYALSCLTEAERARGVLTYSSGNHAQALALAGRLLGVAITVVMPQDAPAIKQAATAGYGGEVVLYDRHRETRESIGEKLAAERGLILIPPYDHPHIIAGQGTAALELVEEVGPLDAAIVCVGGGGLISGWAIALGEASPACRVIGAEPARADDAARSFQTGTLQHNENPDTIADGARTPSLGKLTFPIIRARVSSFITVEEDEILEATWFLWDRMKVVAEPTGALPTAALLKGNFVGQRVGVILSGGNADVAALSRLQSKRNH